MKLRLMCTSLAALSLVAIAYAQSTAPTAPAGTKKTLASGLTIVTYAIEDSGAKDGDVVSILYTGRLADGKEFDSSAMHGGEPYELILGRGMVIKGWDEGIVGMKLGEKRTLIIPPGLAYGPEGRSGVIPPNATLTFDVQLVAIRRPALTQ